MSNRTGQRKVTKKAGGPISPSEVFFALMEERQWDDPRLTLQNRARAIAWALETFREDDFLDTPPANELLTRALEHATSVFGHLTAETVFAALIRMGASEAEYTVVALHLASQRDPALRLWVSALPRHTGPGLQATSDWMFRAYVLSRATGHQGKIHPQHLAAALIAPPPVGDPALRDALRKSGAQLDALCAHLADLFNASPRVDPPENWLIIFNLPGYLGTPPAPAQEQEQEQPPEEPGPPLELVAGIRTDAVDGDQPDRLNIEADVNALASIVAACSVEPPLAIGLFGDWGAGKSFFMSKMEKRLQTLCARPPVTDHNGQPHYFRNIAQIRFNAWHYADGNLWASLMTRIFEGLSLYGVERGQQDVQAMLDQQLRSTELMLGDAEGKLAAAEARRQQAELHIRDMQRRQREVGQKVLQKAGRAALEKVASSIGGRIGARRPELGPAEILKLQAELKTTRGKIKELWQWFREGGRPRRWLLALLILVPLAGWVVPEVLPVLRTGFSPDWLVRLFSGAGGLLTVVTGWAIKYLPKLNGVLKALGEARAEIDKADAEVTGAGEKSLAALVQEEERARGMARQAREEAEGVRKKMREARPSQRVNDFVQERGQSNDYRQHLGLVSLIRNDLFKLSDLLGDARSGGDDAGMPAIDRIVLYIDDLDRCPEDRVVQVLEAIHLLLAFPLFVVVVGVDSRWLLHALRKRYRAFSSSGTATPQAYLEKIFQIPFTLRRMGKDGFGQFMDFLLPASTAPERATGQPGAKEDKPAAEPPQHQPAQPAQAATPPAAPAEDRKEPAAPPSPPPAPPSPPPEPRPELLQLTSPEVEMLKRVWPLIPTPRAANRLANSYRLLRVRLADDRKAAFFGTGDRPAEYPLVIILLAGLIGFPKEFSLLLKQLSEGTARPATWAELRSGLKGRRRLEALHLALGRVDQGLADPVPMESVRYWLAVVCRFSFHLRDETLESEQNMAAALARSASGDLPPDEAPPGAELAEEAPRAKA